jgi:hypothetical protein
MGVFEANLQEILRLMIVQVSTIVPNLQEHSRCGSRQANSVQNCPHDRTGSTGHFLPVSRYVFGILFAFIGFFLGVLVGVVEGVEVRVVVVVGEVVAVVVVVAEVAFISGLSSKMVRRQVDLCSCLWLHM